MARIRLTTKTRIANDPADMQGNREDSGRKTRYQKYTNFDPAKDDVGGRGKAETDGSKLNKQDNELRNQMNITVIRLKQAKMWQRSKLATKLAMYLLGEKAPQSMIKAQAAQFLSLGNAKLAKAVSRWAKTEYLYADQAQTQKPAEKETATQGGKAPATPVQGEKPAQDEKAPATPVQGEKPAQDEKAPAESAQGETTSATATQGETSCASTTDVTADCFAGDNCETAEVVQKADDGAISAELLSSLFEDNSNTLVANKTEVKSSKVGLQKFEQPKKVASKKIDLDQLWKGAPDLSDVF